MRRFVISLLAVFPFAGCDRSKDASAPTTEPSVAVTSPTAEPATQPATVEIKASPIAMKIENDRVEFPPARLRVGTSDGKVVALLYTDDPKDALKDKYSGNSFYFQMELDADEVKNFCDSDWRYKSQSTEQADTPYGIFLKGHREQLQPTNVAITFEPAGGNQTLISISGDFLMVNVEDAAQPPRAVRLLAEFTARTALKS